LKRDLNEICGYNSKTFSEQEENYNAIEKCLLAIVRGITKWRLNQAATTFVKQALDNGPHMRKLYNDNYFYPSLMLHISMLQKRKQLCCKLPHSRN